MITFNQEITNYFVRKTYFLIYVTKQRNLYQKNIRSKTHSCFENCFIRRYIILSSNFDEVDERIRKYVNNYN